MNDQASTRTVIVVEDDDAVRRSLQLLLCWQGFEVRSYPNVARVLGGEDLDAARILVADYRLPDGDGISVLTALKGRRWQGRAFMITGYHSPELERAALRCGYAAVLQKPLRCHELLGLLGR